MATSNSTPIYTSLTDVTPGSTRIKPDTASGGFGFGYVVGRSSMMLSDKRQEP
jgi:hypothetical protein